MEKAFIVIAAAILSWFIAPAQETGVKGAALISNAGEKRKGDIHALVIGISHYANYPGLQYADIDAIAFYRLLLSNAFGADSNNVVLLLNEKATQNRVDEALTNMVGQVKEGDRVFIYFSGHGGVEGLTTSKRGFLFTYETSQSNLRLTSYRIEDLNAIIGELATANKAEVYIIADACHAGKVEESKYRGLSPVNEYIGKISYGTCFLSCSPEELSLEGEQWGRGRGLFSYYLVNGLAGNADMDNDSIVDLNEISFYIKSHVRKDALPHTQNPVITGKEQAICRTDQQFIKSLGYIEPKLSLSYELGSDDLRNILNRYEGNMTAKQLKLYDRFLSSTTTAEARVCLKELLASLETSPLMDINNIGYEENYLGRLTKEQKTLYHSFITALDKSKISYSTLEFVNYSDARSSYELLSSSGIPAGFEAIVRRKMIAALQDRPQQLLDKIISSTIACTSKEQTCLMAENLDYSARLMGENHYLYDITKAKAFFFKIYCYRTIDDFQNYDSLKLNCLSAADSAIAYAGNISFLYVERGDVKSDLKDFHGALSDYSKAIELDPTDAGAYNNRGIAKKSIQDYQGAVSDISTAIELDPVYSSAYFNRGNVKLALAEFQGAISDYTKAIELDPEFTVAYFYRGRAKCEILDYQGAIADFSKTIELDPKFADASKNLSLIYFLQKKYNDAIEISVTALAISPNDPELLDNLGYYYLETGQFDKALDNFMHCSEIENNSVLVDAVLGKSIAYYFLGDKSNAKKSFKEVKRMKPFLGNGLEGLQELENEGYVYSDMIKETLNIIFKKFQ